MGAAKRTAGDVLGTYLLPGRVFDPLDGPKHARDAERLGLGAVWLSDRWEQKEAGVMLGAMAQATTSIRIGTGITHPQTRHPLVLAGMATTLQALSGGRFTLGIGRSAAQVWKGMGVPVPTTQMLRDVADVLRRLWAGEQVTYDGPLGNFSKLRVSFRYEGAPPGLMLAAIGPRSLAVAGEAYDGVILHPFLTTDAVARSAAVVRESAERAGRDPASVRVIMTIAVAPSLSPEMTAAVVGGRAITYLQAPGFGELIVRANGWDEAVLAEVRSHPALRAMHEAGGLADQAFTLQQLGEVARVLPDSWIADGAAVGSERECARRLHDYLEAGADEVILHGNAPDVMAGLIEEFSAQA